MSIGERILELRKDQNISQAQLAATLGISRQAISKWESDQSSPDTIRLIHLAEILNTEVEYLATGRHPVYQQAPITVKIVKGPSPAPKVVEKVIEKPVIRKVVQVKYRRNFTELITCAVVGLILGLFIGIFL